MYEETDFVTEFPAGGRCGVRAELLIVGAYWLAN